MNDYKGDDFEISEEDIAVAVQKNSPSESEESKEKSNSGKEILV